MDNKYTVHANKIRRDKRLIKIAKLVLVLLILFIIFSYMVIGFIYNSGNFTITLDENLYWDRGLIIYDDPEYKQFRTELLAETVETFDNISEGWLPEDLTIYDGSNNGDNYLLYSFYIENQGETPSDYHTQIVIEDVIKDVDEAVRIRVYKDEEYVNYAKIGSNGEPEENTVAFQTDKLVVHDHVESFQPGAITKYTVVIWVDGNDPECTNNIIGGEIKLHMQFNSEFVEN